MDINRLINFTKRVAILEDSDNYGTSRASIVNENFIYMQLRLLLPATDITNLCDMAMYEGRIQMALRLLEDIA